jgi:C4-type Zn-finger protein
MVCPVCKAVDCRRSRRRSLFDYLAALIGNVPWRCSRCNVRFRSRKIPFARAFSAHCSICGNVELKRISGDYAIGFFAPLWRALAVPAFRCIPCRHKFFSLRPLNKEFEEEQYKIAS